MIDFYRFRQVGVHAGRDAFFASSSKAFAINGKKAVAVISLPSAFPRKKARTSVLTFKKARGIKETSFP